MIAAAGNKVRDFTDNIFNTDYTNNKSVPSRSYKLFLTHTQKQIRRELQRYVVYYKARLKYSPVL